MHLIEREGDGAPSRLLDISLLVDVPFLVMSQSASRITGGTLTLQLMNAKVTPLTVPDQTRLVPDCLPGRVCHVIKQGYRYIVEELP
jgi:hypothetical protein